MPTLKGTEVSLSYVQCFLYLVSSSVNVSVFHITWLDAFWKGHKIYGVSSYFSFLFCLFFCIGLKVIHSIFSL